MSLISFQFLFFLLIFGILYFILPKKIQWIVLLAGNLVFYAFTGIQYLIYLLPAGMGSSLIPHTSGHHILHKSLQSVVKRS